MESSNSPFPSQEHHDKLMSILRGLGTTMVTIEFSGSGDSGSIEDAHLEGIDKNVDLSKIPLDWVRSKAVYVPQTFRWETTSEPVWSNVKDVLKQLCNEALEQAGIDWYNNDGGQGQLTIEFGSSPPAITLNVGVNITSTEDYEYSITPQRLERTD